jgi:hypothetical protein
MKKVILVILLALPMVLNANSLTSSVICKVKKSDERKVKVIIKVNGYTITLQGDLQIHIWNGTVTFQGTLTIVGNGINLTIPIYYHGSGNDRVNFENLSEEEILEYILLEEVEKLGILN